MASRLVEARGVCGQGRCAKQGVTVYKFISAVITLGVAKGARCAHGHAKGKTVMLTLINRNDGQDGFHVD